MSSHVNEHGRYCKILKSIVQVIMDIEIPFAKKRVTDKNQYFSLITFRNAIPGVIKINMAYPFFYYLRLHSCLGIHALKLYYSA